MKSSTTIITAYFDIGRGDWTAKEGANKRGNSSRLTQSFHFFMFEPIFSPVNALNQPI
ncbi:WlaTC/HtrL family glycosyltransferase [Escherichia coli]|uniref:WlaTC/HtrL family glycosyltransferase n=1 Tax=Escherichia coli TaxID=562 RepID=UPI0008FF8138|nr:WlaTC/HtrL family glycosyltransferase [Escherichia coli]